MIERRSRFHLQRAQDRLHIVSGFLLAMSNLDSVVKTIRASKDNAEAQKALMHRFHLTQMQAGGVLGMSLRSLTSMETQKLSKEQQNLRLRITDLEDLLAKPDRMLQEVKKEASELEKKHGSGRRTTVVKDDMWQLSELDIIPNVPSILVYSSQGFLKRVKPGSFVVQKRGGKGEAPFPHVCTL